MNRDHRPRRWDADDDAPRATPDGMFGPDGLAHRIQAAVYGAVGCLPRALRSWAAMICHAVNLRRLTAVMTRWLHGDPVDTEQFGRLFLGREGKDPLVVLLHDAVPRVGKAAGHADLGEAATKIAAAILIVGPDRWSRFLAELEARALDPATAAAIEAHAHHPDPPCCTGSPEPAAPADPGQTAPAADDQTADPVKPNGEPAPNHPACVPTRKAAGAGEPSPWRLSLAGSGAVPPVRNPFRLRDGPASQPAWAGAAGRSLWDDQGGEWLFRSGDDWHHPHWDYNAHDDANTPWRSIPMNGRSPWKA